MRNNAKKKKDAKTDRGVLLSVKQFLVDPKNSLEKSFKFKILQILATFLTHFFLENVIFSDTCPLGKYKWYLF